MNCVICKQGETRPGNVTVTLERETTILVVRAIPAQVCENCGEEYLDENVSTQLLEQAEIAAGQGIQVEVREFVAA